MLKHNIAWGGTWEAHLMYCPSCQQGTSLLGLCTGGIVPPDCSSEAREVQSQPPPHAGLFRRPCAALQRALDPGSTSACAAYLLQGHAALSAQQRGDGQNCVDVPRQLLQRILSASAACRPTGQAESGEQAATCDAAAAQPGSNRLG